MLKLINSYGNIRVFEGKKYLFVPYYVVEQNKKYLYYNKLFYSLENIKEKYGI
tara:strand:+ start:86 stop:244 length:159 start_codon:yes stop_codon:yes gene_type:complete